MVERSNVGASTAKANVTPPVDAQRRPWLPRMHFYEINDQSWWPPLLRTYVQDYLTLGWTFRLPLLQPYGAPCEIAARLLTRLLGGPAGISAYTFIDFCSGSGGPTPFIERTVNDVLLPQQQKEKKKGKMGEAEGQEKVRFVMSDIEPNVKAWRSVCEGRGEGLGWVEGRVDASRAPGREVLLGENEGEGRDKKKVMRLFSLAFHHFDDEMARRVLRDALGSDGFCIFELQSRSLPSFILVSLLWPLALLVLAPLYFYNSPGHLFFTYLMPLVPFVWVFDGYISCLRTRTPEEIVELLQSVASEKELERWRFRWGEETHTLVLGQLGWFVGTREDG